MIGGNNVESVRETREDPAGNHREPRKPVTLKGFGVLDDGTTFGISILDLSYNGCKIETELPLSPGLRLRISIVGLGSALEATVRWRRNGRAGLQFRAEKAVVQPQTPRRHERIETCGELSMRRTGRPNYQARVFDLTPTGCRVDFVERPKPGEVLWVKFSGLDSIESTVRWVDGFKGGLEFARPIYPAVFDLLLATLRV